jgi:hypothetical protein
MTNAQILDRALTRLPLPGTRCVSAGVLSLARQLGLQAALPASEHRPLSAEESQSETLALCWLLDERNEIPTLRRTTMQGRDYLFAEVLPDYGFNVPPLLLLNTQKEWLLAGQEMQAGSFDVEPKPGDTASKDQPAGK